jgi:hypothetical protein
MRITGLHPLRSALISGISIALPYILLFLTVLIALAVLIFAFPSLRKPWRRRNILIYTAVALILVLIVYQIDNTYRRAIIAYRIDQTSRFTPFELNQLEFSCINYGEREAVFNLVITGTNISFSSSPTQVYATVNEETVRMPFKLQERWFPNNAENKTMFFTIEENVTGFFLEVSWENQGYSQLVVVEAITGISCLWSEEESTYVVDMNSSFGFVA